MVKKGRIGGVRDFHLYLSVCLFFSLCVCVLILQSDGGDWGDIEKGDV